MSEGATNRERIVNAVAVTLVTLLIWMWAAGETRETESAFTDVRFDSPTADALRIRPEEVETLRLQLRGPRRAIDAVAERLREPISVIAGTDGIPSEPGRHVVDLAQLGATIVEKWRQPVTVVGADPNTVELEIVPLDSREVRVGPVLPSGVRTTGRIEVVPETARVILPGAIAEDLDLEIEARVSERDLAGREPGRRHEFEVPLQLPASLSSVRDSIRIEPRTVQIRLSLESNESELELTAVPVQIAGPAADLQDRVVEVAPEDAFLRQVTVRGPAEAIDRLRTRQNDLGVIAFVHLTSEDLLKDIEEKPVTLWNLPAGVVVTSVDGDATSNPRIALVIKARSDNAETP